jgi:hypothetical protein
MNNIVNGRNNTNGRSPQAAGVAEQTAGISR